MADVYDLFAQGVAFWNQYRKAKPALHVELWDLDLSDSDSSGINLSGATLPLFVAIHANLQGSDFRQADLTHALLRGADLRNADLSGAKLWEADLSGADLTEADLTSANLSGANFRDANLSDATLRRAILNDGTHGAADFSGANIQGCVSCPSDT
jgi:uncharacterized protein YjbI with pentapeptide repeats